MAPALSARRPSGPGWRVSAALGILASGGGLIANDGQISGGAGPAGTAGVPGNRPGDAFSAGQNSFAGGSGGGGIGSGGTGRFDRQQCHRGHQGRHRRRRRQRTGQRRQSAGGSGRRRLRRHRRLDHQRKYPEFRPDLRRRGGKWRQRNGRGRGRRQRSVRRRRRRREPQRGVLPVQHDEPGQSRNDNGRRRRDAGSERCRSRGCRWWRRRSRVDAVSASRRYVDDLQQRSDPGRQWRRRLGRHHRWRRRSGRRRPQAERRRHDHDQRNDQRRPQWRRHARAMRSPCSRACTH